MKTEVKSEPSAQRGSRQVGRQGVQLRFSRDDRRFAALRHNATAAWDRPSRAHYLLRACAQNSPGAQRAHTTDTHTFTHTKELHTAKEIASLSMRAWRTVARRAPPTRCAANPPPKLLTARSRQQTRQTLRTAAAAAQRPPRSRPRASTGQARPRRGPSRAPSDGAPPPPARPPSPEHHASQ